MLSKINKNNLSVIIMGTIFFLLASVSMSLATTQEKSMAFQATDSPTQTTVQDNTEQAETTPEVIQSVTGSVSGTISNGTQDAPTPGNMEVILHIFNEQFSDTKSAITDAEGNFTFPDTTIRTDLNYMTLVFYQGNTFSSDIALGDIENPEITLPITIYELTDDPSSINFELMVLSINAVENGSLQIMQRMTYANISDRVYVTDLEVAANMRAFLEIRLPQGAAITELNNYNRYLLSEDGQTVFDIQPTIPGESDELIIVYMLPFNTEGNTAIEMPINYTAIDGIHIITTLDLDLTGDEITFLGHQAMGENSFNMYETTATIMNNNTLRYEVHRPEASSTDTVSNNTLAMVFFAAGIIMFAFAGFLFWRDRRRSNDPQLRQERIDELIQQIGELDKLYKDGQIDEEDYQKQRNKLKSQVAALMKK
jgi:hypothetical protein